MGIKEQIIATSSSKDDIVKVGEGQGEMYSPDRAIKLNVTNKLLEENEEEKRKEIVGGGGGTCSGYKEKVLEKLAAASVPVDALENARHFIESVIRDVSIAGHGLTKDALLRIKTHLVDYLPSLSPNITRKMVDDADQKKANGQSRESSDGEEEIKENNRQKQDEGGRSSSKAKFAVL